MRKPATFMLTGMLILSTLFGLLIISSELAQSGVVLGGQVTTNTTWDLAGSPWWVEGDVYVENEAVLTIEAGVEVRFNGFYKLCIGNGSLSAIGDPSNKIWFTSNQSSPWAEDWYGIQANSTGHLDIKYSNITYGQYAIDIDQAKNNDIQHNEITINYEGIRVSLSENNTIFNNNVSDNIYTGIFISESANNQINNNTVYSNGWNGVHLYASTNNTVLNNSIDDNFYRGVYVFDTTVSNISLNHIYSNGEGIFVLATSVSNIITKNNISENSNFGVNLTTSSSNRVYNNIFWNNPLQAYDESLNNFWDDGYPTGGNYWSDFDEAVEGAYDNFTGPGQNQNGSDGIVDTPYLNIGGGAGVLDNFPLMRPQVARTFVYLSSPLNNSIIIPGTLLDFVVVGENIDYLNYTVNGGPDTTLLAPWDINDTVTGTWTDGPYLINITVYDLDGNMTEFWFNLTVDSILPTIILNSPTMGSLITPGTQIDLNVTDTYLYIVNFTLDGGLNSTILAPFDIDTGLWADGNRTIVVYAQDMAGNLNFTTYNFTIDGLSPSIFLEPPTTNNSVVLSGTPLLFNITDPHLDMGAINYSVNGGPMENFNYTGVFEINTTVWPDDTYTIDVYAKDVLGNLKIRSFTFAIDNTLPTILLLAPSNGSIFQEGEVLYFNVIDDNIDTVFIFENEIFAGAFSIPYIWNTIGEVDGPYSITIEAQDLAGNFNSKYFNFTIATPPTIELDTPSNNSLIIAGTLIEFTILDINLDKVNYTVNSVDFGDLPSPHNIDTTGWNDGPYWIEIIANDTAGNSNSSLYFFTLDSSPPEINLISHANNSCILPGDIIQFEIIEDNIILVTNSTNGGTYNPFPDPYRIDTFGWDDGVYSFSIKASDALGSESERYFIITIDSTKPTITLISPPDGSSLEIGAFINLSVVDLNLFFVNYTVNSQAKGNISFPFSINTDDFPDGNCIVMVYAEDLAGNFETKSYSFIFNDTTAPEIILKSPEDITYIPSDILIEFEIIDLFFQNASYSIDGDSFEEFSASPYIIDTSNWTEGDHTLIVRAYDTRNNLNETVYSIKKDTINPIIYLVSPDDNSVIVAGTDIQFVITDDNLDRVNYTVNGGALLGLTSPYSIPTDGWEDNSYSIEIRAKDKAGNEIIETYNFIVDSTLPQIFLNQPVNGSLIKLDAQIDFSILDDNIDSVTYFLNGGGSVVLPAPYDINATDLVEGENTIRIVALDLAQNSFEATFTFTLDSISPKVSSIFAAQPYYPYNHTRIIITFSEPMDTDSVEAALNTSPKIQYTLTWYNKGQELWLVDLIGLEYNEYYVVDFKQDVYDLAGNPLVNFTGYGFIATFDIYQDSDKDEMPDGWEFYYDLNPDDPSDAGSDFDGDGYTNLEEFKGDSDPTDSKSIPRGDETQGPELWWLFLILVAMLLISIILVYFLLKERKEEPKGPKEEVEDMYIAMRAQQDITAMEEILADKEKLGERIYEAEIMLEKAKEAFEKGDYKVITVYEQTLRNLLMEIDIMGEGEVKEQVNGNSEE